MPLSGLNNGGPAIMNLPTQSLPGPDNLAPRFATWDQERAHKRNYPREMPLQRLHIHFEIRRQLHLARLGVFSCLT
jgi:hypothetical protein